MNNDKNKSNVTTFISNLAGSLQCVELNTLNMLDQADQAFDYSITDIISQLNCFIDVSIFWYQYFIVIN